MYPEKGMVGGNSRHWPSSASSCGSLVHCSLGISSLFILLIGNFLSEYSKYVFLGAYGWTLLVAWFFLSVQSWAHIGISICQANSASFRAGWQPFCQRWSLNFSWMFCVELFPVNSTCWKSGIKTTFLKSCPSL